MKIISKVKLLEKGWSDAEIKKASAILERAKKQDIFFFKLVFWTALIVVVFANLLISLILIPFLIVFQRWVLYSIVILLGGMTGFLYNFLITDIGYLEKKHHWLAGIIVPILALVNIIMMVVVSNQLIKSMKIVANEQHDPFLIGVIFTAAFILPYIIDKFRLAVKGKNKLELAK